MQMETITFTGHTTSGSGRGMELGYPTINVHLEDVPEDIEEGIYAGIAYVEDQPILAAIHYGPRPCFDDSITFEVHLIDHSPTSVPDAFELKLFKRLRSVQNFPTEEELKEQIAMDIEETNRILDF